MVIKLNFCSDFGCFGQDFEVEKFRRDFEAEVCSCFVEVTKLNCNQDSEVRFGQDLKFKFSRYTYVWLKF